jgi:four helix bundle protein
MASNYRQLIAWQRAMNLVCSVYEETRTFPKEELFGLTAQMRKAAASVPNNIAEGDGRRGPADQRKFFLIARGSLLELETQVEIAKRIGILTIGRAVELFTAIEASVKPLNGLIQRIDRDLPPAASRQLRANVTRASTPRSD